MALFAVILLLVTDRRAHPGRLWAVPVVVARLGERPRQLLPRARSSSVSPGSRTCTTAVGAAASDAARSRSSSAVAACVTPFGPAVWAYAVGLSTNPEVTGRITEWQPTSLRDVPGLLFFGSALAVVALHRPTRAHGRRGRSLAWLGVVLRDRRVRRARVAWWPLGGGRRRRRRARPVRRRGRREAPSRRDAARCAGSTSVVAGAIVLAGIALLPVWRPIDPGLGAPAGRRWPTRRPGITAALRELAGPATGCFNPQPWGSWFEFAVPDLPVAIDSRIELFPARGLGRLRRRRRRAATAGRPSSTRWGVTIAVVGDATP